jgi:hypothetical protein
VAVADLGDPELFDELIAGDDEYRTFCGVVGIGRAAADPRVAARMHELSKDGRWRVREAVAMGLQRLGDADLPALERIVLAWAADPHPLVQRAAAAAVCEPRLLRAPEAAATAVEVCRRATAALAARPADERRDPDVRTLRQGLGYCWSVAVAADPEPGVAAFAALRDETDPGRAHCRALLASFGALAGGFALVTDAPSSLRSGRSRVGCCWVPRAPSRRKPPSPASLLRCVSADSAMNN